MERIFNQRQLPLSASICPNEKLPPSLPLVLSKKFEYNFQTHTLEKVGSAGSESEPSKSPFQLIGLSVELLRTIKKPVAVLSIGGPYRTGKSYFLSQFLGPEVGTFELGHSMKACTQGIWMATTILECKEFAVVLLDTEGTNSGSQDDNSTILLTLTTLLSSTFIYNSRNVPKQRDIRKLSLFTKMSEQIRASESEPEQPQSISMHMPHFVWLLRDVDRVPTNRNGEKISLTEYFDDLLKSIRENNTQSLNNKIVAAFVKLFPTIRYEMLPPPHTDPNVVADLVSNKDILQPKFVQDLDIVTKSILQSLQPKNGFDISRSVGGVILASLIEQYFVSINTPDKLTVLESSWKNAVVELKLAERAEQLADEYETDMTAKVSPQFPLEEGFDDVGDAGHTLQHAHLQIFKEKRDTFQQEAKSFYHSTELLKSTISRFESMIVQYKEDGSRKKVVGGKLFMFMEQNVQKSKVFCEKIYASEYKPVETLIDSALTNCEPKDIREALSQFKEQYRQKAIGPAKHKVYAKYRPLSEIKEEELSKIPGVINSLKVVGISGRRIKLRWNAPKDNPKAVKEYEIHVKPKNEEMVHVKSRKRCSVVIDNLENSKFHLFLVRAKNDKYIGNFGLGVATKTDISVAAFSATVVTLFLVGPAIVFASLPHMFSTESSETSCESDDFMDLKTFDETPESELVDNSKSFDRSGHQDVIETDDEKD